MMDRCRAALDDIGAVCRGFDESAVHAPVHATLATKRIILDGIVREGLRIRAST